MNNKIKFILIAGVEFVLVMTVMSIIGALIYKYLI